MARPGRRARVYLHIELLRHTRAGTVVAISGRPPVTRYGCPLLPAPTEEPDPRGALLVETVAALEAARADAPSTQQVREARLAAGHPAVSSARPSRGLGMLARAAKRGQGAWLRVPRLERVGLVTATGYGAAGGGGWRRARRVVPGRGTGRIR